MKIRQEKEFDGRIENSFVKFPYDVGIAEGGANPVPSQIWWFWGWVFVSLWLGFSWVMIQHGRELWGRIRAIRAYQEIIESQKIMSNLSEESDQTNHGDPSRKEGDLRK